MKIVIPTNGNKVAEHFGRSRDYTILDEQGKIIKVIKNSSSHMGGNKLPPQIIKELGADILLCKGIGPKAIQLCNSLGIKIYVGNEITIKGLFNKWKNGLKEATINDSCNEHK